MKRFLCLLLALAMLVSLCACKKKEELNYDVYASPEDITVESIIGMTSPQIMLTNAGAFQVDIRNDDPFNAGAEASTTSLRYAYNEDGNVDVNQLVDYDDGTFAHVFFTTDPDDPYMYYLNEEGAQTLDMTQYELELTMSQTMFGLEYYNTELTAVGKDERGYYVATIECYTDDEDHTHMCTYNMTMDPVSGYVYKVDTVYYSNDQNAGATQITVTYSASITIDKQPKELAPVREVPAAQDTASAKTGTFNFAAHDLDGNFVSSSDFADAKLIMVNFWEPWCVNCLDEMPDLKVLYEDYKDQGFVILGVTCDTDALDDARAVVQEYALTYPTVQADSHLSAYATDYVPTTYFVDANGELLTEEPYVGAKSYEEWTAIVADFLAADAEEAESAE